MSKAKKNILFAALAALALTVCLVGVTGAYFIAQASRTNTLTVGEVTFDPKEDIQNPDVPVQPGNSFMKRPYVVNTGNLPLRLRARVIFSDSAAQDACTLNYNTENWRYDETEDFWYYAKTLQPGEDCRNDALFDTVTYSESADATALNHYTLTLKRFRRAERGEKTDESGRAADLCRRDCCRRADFRQRYPLLRRADRLHGACIARGQLACRCADVV